MHQWSTVTYMHSGPRNMEVFRDWIVKKSLEYPYLMDILLAFTSLHSASQAVKSGEAYEHVTAALHYQNQSIAELNRASRLPALHKRLVSLSSLLRVSMLFAHYWHRWFLLLQASRLSL